MSPADATNTVGNGGSICVTTESAKTAQVKSSKPRKRRSNWAAQLEHLVPGSKQMSDDQLELWLTEILRRPR
jgi:hypothetical protein